MLLLKIPCMITYVLTEFINIVFEMLKKKVYILVTGEAHHPIKSVTPQSYGNFIGA